jgi:TATA-binding protein-associated factor
MTIPPAARPFFLGLREVPSLPHLILCPGTLVVQWINELKVFFLPRSVDILVYDSKVDGTHFWGPSGPLHSSVHEPYHRIVIATHSVSKISNG